MMQQRYIMLSDVVLNGFCTINELRKLIFDKKLCVYF